MAKKKKPIWVMLNKQKTKTKSKATGKTKTKEPEPRVKDLPTVRSKARKNRNRRNKRKWNQRQRNNNVSNHIGKANNYKNTILVFSAHPMQACWEHAPPRPYQRNKLAENGYFHSA